MDYPKVWAKEKAQHKEKILNYDVCTGVVKVMKDFIVKAVDEEWRTKTEDGVMGFTNTIPIKMLDQ